MIDMFDESKIAKIFNDIEAKKLSKTYLDKEGNTIDNINNKDVYAKIIYLNDKEHSYHLRVLENNLYDPLGTYSNRRRFMESTFKKVSKSTFDNYVIYLKTNNSIYFTKAQRGFLND